MTYGFEVYSNTGQVQFNDRSPNYFLVDQGFVNGGFTAGGPGFLRTIWANIPQGNPATFNNYLVAIRPVNGVGAVVDQDGFRPLSGTSTYVPRFNIYAQAAHAQVYWYVFARGDVDHVAPLPSYGLVVYDPTGRITYRSDQRVLRVVDAVIGNSFTASRTLPAGRAYAFINGGRKVAFINNRRYNLWGQVNGNIVSFAETNVAATGLGYDRFMSQLLVDVTNY